MFFKFTFYLHRNKSKKSKKFKSSSSSVDIESDNTRTGSKTNKASNESIKHLTEFLDDRKELHAQLFSIIPKKEVKEMMPNILKVIHDVTIISKDQMLFFLCRMLLISATLPGCVEHRFIEVHLGCALYM